MKKFGHVAAAILQNGENQVGGHQKRGKGRIQSSMASAVLARGEKGLGDIQEMVATRV